MIQISNVINVKSGQQPAIVFAAENLKKYLQEILGCKVTINGDTAAIAVGNE